LRRSLEISINGDIYVVLDYIATSVLHCGSDAHQSVQLRKKRSDGNDTNDDTPDVVRIRYPEFGQITSVCKSFWMIVCLSSSPNLSTNIYLAFFPNIQPNVIRRYLKPRDV